MKRKGRSGRINETNLNEFRADRAEGVLFDIALHVDRADPDDILADLVSGEGLRHLSELGEVRSHAVALKER